MTSQVRAVPSRPRIEVATATGTGAETFELSAVHVDATQATVGVRGEMDLSTADLAAGVLDNQLACGYRFVRLDLSRLTFLDCAGLRVLVHTHNRFLAAGGTMVLTGVGPGVARLLRITGLDEALLIADGPSGPPRVRRRQHLSVVGES